LKQVEVSRTTKPSRTNRRLPPVSGRAASEKLSDADGQALSDELMNDRCRVWELFQRTTWSHISAAIQPFTWLPGWPADAPDCAERRIGNEQAIAHARLALITLSVGVEVIAIALAAHGLASAAASAAGVVVQPTTAAQSGAPGATIT
jgi:hypothetical protein